MMLDGCVLIMSHRQKSNHIFLLALIHTLTIAAVVVKRYVLFAPLWPKRDHCSFKVTFISVKKCLVMTDLSRGSDQTLGA